MPKELVDVEEKLEHPITLGPYHFTKEVTTFAPGSPVQNLVETICAHFVRPDNGWQKTDVLRGDGRANISGKDYPFCSVAVLVSNTEKQGFSLTEPPLKKLISLSMLDNVKGERGPSNIKTHPLTESLKEADCFATRATAGFQTELYLPKRQLTLDALLGNLRPRLYFKTSTGFIAVEIFPLEVHIDQLNSQIDEQYAQRSRYVRAITDLDETTATLKQQRQILEANRAAKPATLFKTNPIVHPPLGGRLKK